MTEPFRLRYVNQVVGAFILLVVVLMILGTVLVVQQQDIFVADYEIYAYIAEREMQGLGKGTEVLVLGRPAGEIEDISYTKVLRNGKNVKITLKIKETFQHEIFTDSLAHIKRRLAGAGEAFIEITRGPEHKEILRARGTIRIEGEREPGSELVRVADTIVEISQDVDGARVALEANFDKLGKASEDLGRASRDIVDTNERFQSVITDLKRVSPELPRLADDIKTLINGSQQVVDALRAETEELPGTVRQFRDDLDGAQDVIDAVRRHWLLRRYTDRPDTEKLISPADLGRGMLP